ncbi:unnamed protein product [Closterium sp. Naga37s-1]|nr:unnamed protein product [Closterium sp. Naga37s-1]
MFVIHKLLMIVTAYETSCAVHGSPHLNAPRPLPVCAGARISPLLLAPSPPALRDPCTVAGAAGTSTHRTAPHCMAVQGCSRYECHGQQLASKPLAAATVLLYLPLPCVVRTAPRIPCTAFTSCHGHVPLFPRPLEQHCRWRPQGGAVRAHTSMSPAAAYRMAMCALNTHAGVLEVLGAPLLGAPVRAYVQGGGGIVLSGMAVRAAPRDCWLVFPVRGAEGRGVVQVHVHRHNGQYDLRLVAVDVAAGSAGSECVVVVGDHAALSRAQPLLQGLRHALDNAQGGRAGAETRAVENAQQEQG